MGSGTVIIDGELNLTVSENAGVITGDLDNIGTHTGVEQWSLLSAPSFGTLTINPDTGEWTYTFDPDDPIFETLDEGQSQVIAFEVRLLMGATTEEVNMTIVIEGVTDPCYAKNTRIETNRGLKEIENLKVGDMVRTLSNGFQPIEWIGSIRTQAKGQNAAVRIPRNAFQKNMPRKDLIVSPSHLILLKNFDFGLIESFQMAYVPAHFLTMPEAAHLFSTAKRPERVEFVDEEIEYYHFILPKHDIVVAENIWSESLNIGELSIETFAKKGQVNMLELEELHCKVFASAAPTLRKSEWLKICESLVLEARSKAVCMIG